jgi:hypothetical protein
VVELQDQDESSQTFGVWPYYLEEPLAEMNPPDANWADFIGARLAHVVIEHAGKISANALEAARGALGRAARAIVKRDMVAEYTNIAVMGSGVAAAAGEALGEPQWIDYGRRKLAAGEESVARNGSFAEYNSPTYTVVALEECERMLQLVRDPVVRDSAQRLLEVAWRLIADHWHPATQQWAGPHARAYSDRLMPAALRRIARATGIDVAISPEQTPGCDGLLVHPQPCPVELLPRFRHLPSDPTKIHQRCRRGEEGQPDRVATTWFSASACLGSFNRGHLWNQSRPLIGYWSAPGRCAVVRARLLIDGEDFAAGHIVQDQRGPRVLSAVHFWSGAGLHHPFFGVPPDGIVRLADLRLRISVEADNAELRAVRDGVWSLRAGEHQLVVHTLPGRLGEEEIVWSAGRDDRRGWLDAICVAGPVRRLAVAEVPLQLAFAVELIGAEQSPSASPLSVSSDGQRVAAAWIEPGLLVSVPLRAVPMQW